MVKPDVYYCLMMKQPDGSFEPVYRLPEEGQAPSYLEGKNLVDVIEESVANLGLRVLIDLDRDDPRSNNFKIVMKIVLITDLTYESENVVADYIRKAR